MERNNCIIITPEGDADALHIDFSNLQEEIRKCLDQCKDYVIIGNDDPCIGNLSNFADAPLCLCYNKSCDSRSKENEGNNDVVNDLMAAYKYHGNCLIFLYDKNHKPAPMTEENIRNTVALLEEYHGANLWKVSA